jgi:H+/Cl- antiporter ClcA
VPRPPQPLPSDPKALIRSRPYNVLLVLAALVGLIVSCASWLFLEAVHEIEVDVYETLPHDLGYEHVPLWRPLPWLALAGLLTAFAVVRLPGRGGHVPADKLKTGDTPLGPIDLPGVLLAALATLALGFVLGRRRRCSRSETASAFSRCR